MIKLDLNNREELEKILEHGMSIIAELFKLSDKDLILKIKDIVDEKYHEIVDNSPTTRRIIENQIPTKIEIFYYDKLTIEWYGIDYCPEHGIPTRIRDFDEFFKLN